MSHLHPWPIPVLIYLFDNSIHRAGLTIPVDSTKARRTMIPHDLAKLERETRANPDNTVLRSRYYVHLIRLGRVQERAILLAAGHGDPAAQLIIEGNAEAQRIVTDKDMACMKNLPLHSLNLNHVYQITDHGMSYLRGMPLRSLNLAHCYQLSDKALKNLAGMPLRSLSLLWRKRTTNLSLQYIQDLPLEILNLGDCHQITDRGLQFLKKMPLKTLSLRSCNLLTTKGLQELEALPIEELSLVWTNLDPTLAQSIFPNARIQHTSMNHS